MDRKYTDIELSLGCVNKDPKFQHALVMQYSEGLYATAVRYIKDTDEAKDILQDSFLKIFKSMHQFDPSKGSLSAWMSKVVVNQAIKYWHKQKRQVAYEDYLPVTFEQPLILDKLNSERLYHLITTLEDPYRMVFNLHVIEGYSHKEIAEKLNVKTSSSRSMLTRAKSMLRTKIARLKKQKAWI